MKRKTTPVPLQAPNDSASSAPLDWEIFMKSMGFYFIIIFYFSHSVIAGAIHPRGRGDQGSTSSSSSSSSARSSVTLSSSNSPASSSSTIRREEKKGRGDEEPPSHREPLNSSCDSTDSNDEHHRRYFAKHFMKAEGDEAQFDELQSYLEEHFLRQPSFLDLFSQDRIRQPLIGVFERIIPSNFSGDRFFLIERTVLRHLTTHSRRMTPLDPDHLTQEFVAAVPYLLSEARTNEGKEMRAMLARAYHHYYEAVLPPLMVDRDAADIQLGLSALLTLQEIIEKNSTETVRHFIAVPAGTEEEIQAHRSHIRANFSNAFNDGKQRQALFEFLYERYLDEALPTPKPYIDYGRGRELIHNILVLMEINTWPGDYALFFCQMVEWYFTYTHLPRQWLDIRSVVPEFTIIREILYTETSTEAGLRARIAMFEAYNDYFSGYVSSGIETEPPEDIATMKETCSGNRKLLEAWRKQIKKIKKKR